jgi:hypothetical protein
MIFNFDNTILKDYATCEAMAIVKHIFGLRGKAEKIAADIGNVFHAAEEEHFRGADQRRVMEVFGQRYDMVIPPGQQPEEDRFARGNVIKIMEQYVKTRPVEAFPWVPVSFEEVKGVRLEEDGEGELVFWVKRDMLGKEKSTGFLVPVDHKTTHRLTSWWARTFRLCSQLSGYCWFTGKETGQPVMRAYVNGIEVAKLPDSNRKCPTHGVKYMECSAEHSVFYVYQYNRSPEMLEKWRQDAIVIAKKARMMGKVFTDLGMIKYALRQGAFVEHCRFCEFKDWCEVEFAADMAEEFTVYDPWRPWELEGALRIDRGTVPAFAAKEEPAPRVQWFYRQATDSIHASVTGSPGMNWTELPEKMALKALWEKGRDAWMGIWGGCKEAQEAMAAFARERSV